MNYIKTKVSVAVGSALMINAIGGMSSGMKHTVEFGFFSNSTVGISHISDIRSSSLILESKQREGWTAQKGLRFKELIRKNAAGQISIPELAEFKSLSALRRREKFPLNADQILWQRKQDIITDKLLSVLKEYAEFHNIPSSA